jgi:histo-blood group ABO system transferase
VSFPITNNQRPIANFLITLALSTDERGFSYNATLIASILRRTARAVWVRCWCRGFLPESFETGRLRVEFIHAVDEITGKFPGYVGPAVFDRLRIINDCSDWDRCLIMDYDQVALCDLGPLFDMELGDALLAAKMQGPGVDMAHAMREWIKRPLPDGWEHVGAYPYFSMGPLMNLKAMREAGTWQTLLAAHAAFGVDEQLSLTAATEGRTIGFERKWNLFPKSDIPKDAVPEGVIHWLGWPKPWHKGAKVWRPDIWESERATWEHLRMGIWEKPLAIEVEPEDGREVRALLERGWKVTVVVSPDERESSASPRMQLEELGLEAFPDLEVRVGCPSDLAELLANLASPPDIVRVGPWTDFGAWLAALPLLPQHLVLRGGMESDELETLRALGYFTACRLKLGEWPAGGPLPRVLDYGPLSPGSPLQSDEAIFLKREDRDPLPAIPSALRFARSTTRYRAENPKKIGVLVIATAKYRRYIKPLLASIRRNFLVGHDVTVFLYTDGNIRPAPDLRVIPVVHSAWPGMAIRRHAIFNEHAAAFEEMDYLFYLDADMRVIGKVGEEFLGDLVAVIHPGFHDQSRERFTYEKRAESTACIQPWEGTRYFCSAVQGGTRQHFLAAVSQMAAQIEADSARGVTAVWHDESHWNRYLIDRPPTLVLSPSYCWYPDGRSAEFEGRIAVVLKDAAEVRRE